MGWIETAFLLSIQASSPETPGRRTLRQRKWSALDFCCRNESVRTRNRKKKKSDQSMVSAREGARR